MSNSVELLVMDEINARIAGNSLIAYAKGQRSMQSALVYIIWFHSKTRCRCCCNNHKLGSSILPEGGTDRFEKKKVGTDIVGDTHNNNVNTSA
jgi:hypothetical protein